ncbi:MAG: hypothetical protein QM817_25985 [Archangium sp.]
MRTALLALTALTAFACLEPLPMAAPQSEQSDWVCSPSNCSGCCKNNQCLGGNTEVSCGIGGSRCAACAEQQKCVSPGMCVWIDPVTGARLPNGNSLPSSDPRQPGGSTQKCITLGNGQMICN